MRFTTQNYSERERALYFRVRNGFNVIDQLQIREVINVNLRGREESCACARTNNRDPRNVSTLLRRTTTTRSRLNLTALTLLAEGEGINGTV